MPPTDVRKVRAEVVDVVFVSVMMMLSIRMTVPAVVSSTVPAVAVDANLE